MVTKEEHAIHIKLK